MLDMCLIFICSIKSFFNLLALVPRDLLAVSSGHSFAIGCFLHAALECVGRPHSGAGLRLIEDDILFVMTRHLGNN